MRRLAAIAAFALFLAVPLWAQRGGGGHFGGGGGHASFGGGHFSGGFSGGHSFAGSRSFGGSVGARSFSGTRSRGFSGGFGRGFSHNGFSHYGFGRNRGVRIRSYPYGNCYGYNCGYGYGYGYPWWGYGDYDPWMWGDDDSSYDDSYQQDLANANDMNEQSLEQQQMFRQEEADGDQDAYAPRQYATRPAPQSGQSGAIQSDIQGASFVPATVLVFRDQHREEIQNYAIIGQTLWNFAPGRTQKISLADLDLPATTKANDDRGVTFRLPIASEAQ
jgi:hypothetical protein